MKSPVTVVGGVVTLLFLTVALVIGLSVTGGGFSEETKTTILVSMLALVGSTIPSVLALYKAEGAHKSSMTAERTAHDVYDDLQNGGSVKSGVKEAMHEMAEEENSAIVLMPAELLTDKREGENDGRQGV